MFDTIKELLLSLVRSKKFAGMLVGLIVSGLSYLGLEGEEAQAFANGAVGLAAVYVASQGLADHGKERAIVETGTVLD